MGELSSITCVYVAGALMKSGPLKLIGTSRQYVSPSSEVTHLAQFARTSTFEIMFPRKFSTRTCTHGMWSRELTHTLREKARSALGFMNLRTAIDSTNACSTSVANADRDPRK
jgi:hypothetical protein